MTSDPKARFVAATPPPPENGGCGIWLGRAGCLALMAGAWLGFAAFVESWTTEVDLLLRGKTAVAKMTKEEKDRVRRELTLHPRRWYYFEADGREYKASVEGTESPEGKAVTYLPESPSVHRLGVIQARSAAKDVGFTLIACVLTSPVTFGFFGFCVTVAGPGRDPNRLGWWIILGLGGAAHALAFATILCVRQPLPAILAWYLPVFVGSVVAALLGVRLLARRWGVELEQGPEETGRHSPPLVEPTIRVVTGPEPAWAPGQGGPGPEERQAAAVPHGPAAANQPADPTPCYRVTCVPDGDTLVTLTADQIRELLRLRALEVSWYASESAGGRQRTLTELLAEWGETPPSPSSAAGGTRWRTARAAMSGAGACLLLVIAGAVVMHAAAALFHFGGASWPWITFFTSTDSILLDLIMCSIGAAFGALRGVVYHGGHLADSGETYGAIGERAAMDLGRLRDTSGPLAEGFERIAYLLLATLLASPVIAILLLVWRRA